MSTIQDGKGRGNVASVSSSNRLNVSAKQNPRSYYVSRDEERFFSWYSNYSASSGDYVIYIENTDQDRKLVISSMIFCTVGGGKFTVGGASGTGTGTVVDATNFNIGSGRRANANALGNAAVTGLTAGSVYGAVRVTPNASGAGTSSEALILGNGDTVSVRFDGTAGEIDVTIFGYFEDHNPLTN